MFSWQLRLIDLCSNHPCVPCLIMHTRLWWPDKLRQRACLHPGLHTGGRIYRVFKHTYSYNVFCVLQFYLFPIFLLIKILRSLFWIWTWLKCNFGHRTSGKTIHLSHSPLPIFSRFLLLLENFENAKNKVNGHTAMVLFMKLFNYVCLDWSRLRKFWTMGL